MELEGQAGRPSVPSGESDNIKHKSVVVTFKNPFSDRNGKVEMFSVIVSTSSNSIPEHVDTWTESKVGTGPRTFIAIWKCDPFFSKGDACWVDHPVDVAGGMLVTWWM